jgi:4-amino-4-deoxy-L-arabinose transferase-like glycosyltransferase
LSSKSPQRTLLLIIVLAALLRTAVIVCLPTQPISDFWSYLSRAQNLVEHGEYAPFPGAPDASYPPAYPLLLTAAVLLPGDPITNAKAINVLLGVLLVALSWALARRLWGPREAAATAILVALYPRYILLPALLASENLFAPLLLAWLLLAVSSFMGNRPLKAAAWAGVILGLLTLTRSAGYLLWVLWPIAGFAAGKRWRMIMRELVLLVVVQHAVLLPWAVRNSMTFGDFSFLTSTRGINLFIGNRPEATGRWTEWLPDLQRIDPEIRDRNPFEQSRIAGREARRWIVHHPLDAADLDTKKLFMLVTDSEKYLVFYTVSGSSRSVPPGGAEVLPVDHPARRHAPLLLTLLNISFFAVGALQVLGGFLLLRRARRTRHRETAAGVILLGGTAAYFLLTASVFFAASRFRWPAVDALMPLAGFVLAHISHRRSAATGDRPHCDAGLEDLNRENETPPSPAARLTCHRDPR